MRIGFLCVRYPPSGTPGGVRFFVQTLAQRLAAFGHCPIVVSQESLQSAPLVVDSVSGIRVYRFRATRARPGTFWERRQFSRMATCVVRRERVDVLETFVDHGILSGHGTGCPLVARLHSSEQLSRKMAGESASRVTGFFERRLLRHADIRVGVSDWVARNILSVAGLGHLPYRVIYNGVDTDRFRPGPSGAVRPGQLLFSGRLTERKGLPVLFQAVPRVMRQFPEVTLRCVGPSPIDSGYPSRVAERYLSTLPSDLRSRVEFTGPVAYERMHEQYPRAELCVLPSLIEGHPLVVLEAMSCGVPSVFSRHGVGPEVITDGEDGFLCDVRDPRALADTICRALERCRADIGIRERARQKVEVKFSLDQATTANVKLYDEAVRRERGA
jgi:glycosyltransferase involved in cell wall biosynthesis